MNTTNGSGNLSIRISKDLKEQMKDVNINWSEYLRAAIENKIKEAKRKKAAKSMDTIRRKTKLGAFDSGQSVREDRDS